MKIELDQSTQDISIFLSENIELIGYGLFAIVIFILFINSSYKNKKAKAYLKEAINKNLNEPLTMHPLINESLCMGCSDCTRVCPEGDILQMINHKAVLINAAKCVGHGVCEIACPVGAIDLVFGTKKRGMDIPRISSHYETNVSGIYIAGELGGMGLISNAIKQGQLAAEHALSKSTNKNKTDVELLIVGAGPAGISASLAATKLKKKYLTIDQNSIGGTVYNFPRQKIVMIKPIKLPLEGIMKFSKDVISKESLLSAWKEIIKKYKLNIKEKTKFEGITGENDNFQVTVNGQIITTKKVILALGVRGSPRKLGLVNEDLPKVSYNLIDPEQYQQRNIVIVGGGNSAIESAQYLARKQYNNKITILVRGDEESGLKRCAEENKVLIHQCVARGNVKFFYNAAVLKIDKKHIKIRHGDDSLKLANDYLFIFAGAEMPYKFLMGLGIKIDKKHGAKLEKS